MKSIFAFSLVLLVVSCTNSQDSIKGTQTANTPTLTEFKLVSPAFEQSENIPAVYTCDSTNISPELHWNKPAGKVASYTLIVDDPDAPMGTWVHWVVFNIPASDSMLSSGFAKDSAMANGTRQGITSFHDDTKNNIGYGGPCPPNGSHRYFFKLYALDTVFNLPCNSSGEKKLTEAMKGHILAEASLMGRYERKNPK